MGGLGSTGFERALVNIVPENVHQLVLWQLTSARSSSCKEWLVLDRHH